MTALTLVLNFLTIKWDHLRTGRERGSLTMQEVLWGAFWVGVAIAATVVIGSFINSKLSQIAP